MGDEDAEYDFLYHIVPELEKLADVYATSAVKTRLHMDAPPKVTLSMDERTDWLICKFDIDGIPESEIRHLLKSLEEKRRFHRLPSGAFCRSKVKNIRKSFAFINETGMSRSEDRGCGNPLPAHALHLMESPRQGSTLN